MKGVKRIALFDFDGTITSQDTFIDFFQSIYGKKKIFILCIILLPFILLYFVKLLPAIKLKEQFLIKLIKGWSIEKFKNEAVLYHQNGLKKIIKNSAIKEIEFHKKSGTTVVIVSASPEQWIMPFAQQWGLDVIATKLEMKNDFFTGRIAGKNCYGIEKVKRINEKYNLNEFDEIYAYGDSKGDSEMLEIATKKFYRHFQ